MDRQTIIDSMVKGGMASMTCCFDDGYFYVLSDDGREWLRLDELSMAYELYQGLKTDIPNMEEPGFLDQLVDALKLAATGYFENKGGFNERFN